MRTYSRLNRKRTGDTDDNGACKRQRLETPVEAPKPKRTFTTLKAWLKDLPPAPSSTSSSTRGDAIFLDEASLGATPPSSPPAPLSDPDQDCDAEYASAPLRPIGSNARGLLDERPRDPKQMVQMQINLGSALQKTCADCGMTFLKTSVEDNVLHDRFHSRNANGLDLGKAFRRAAEARTIARGRDDGIVVLIDANDKAFEKRKAEEVLGVVQMELGAVDIAEQDLWARTDGTRGRPRYRFFLYLLGTRCVGLCLAKQISEASTVIPDPEMPDGDWCLSADKAPASIGISRIWCSTSHRQRGVATALLDATAGHFDSGGSHVAKRHIAFSQPTTRGTALARRWFDQGHGWLVYSD